jgi:hypothetical protein
VVILAAGEELPLVDGLPAGGDGDRLLAGQVVGEHVVVALLERHRAGIADGGIEPGGQKALPVVGIEQQPALAAVGADLVEVDQVERLAGEGERVGLPEERFRVGEGSEQAGDARLPAVEGSTVAGLAGLLLHILRAQHGRSLPFLVSDRLFSALDRAPVV